MLGVPPDERRRLAVCGGEEDSARLPAHPGEVHA